MNQYTIYCTEAQTRKALELGAPLDIEPRDGNLIPPKYPKIIIKYPTAEQMIGWLESEKLFSFDIRQWRVTWSYNVRYKLHTDPIREDEGLDSRKEATLEAIDAALEYLVTHKQ